MFPFSALGAAVGWPQASYISILLTHSLAYHVPILAAAMAVATPPATAPVII